MKIQKIAGTALFFWLVCFLPHHAYGLDEQKDNFDASAPNTWEAEEFDPCEEMIADFGNGIRFAIPKGARVTLTSGPILVRTGDEGCEIQRVKNLRIVSINQANFNLVIARLPDNGELIGTYFNSSPEIARGRNSKKSSYLEDGVEKIEDWVDVFILPSSSATGDKLPVTVECSKNKVNNENLQPLKCETLYLHPNGLAIAYKFDRPSDSEMLGTDNKKRAIIDRMIKKAQKIKD